MLNSTANMYPWYRDSMSQLGQFCGNNLGAPIKTENGYNDCMLALDYAQNKKAALAVWSPAGDGGGGGGQKAPPSTPPTSQPATNAVAHWMSVMAEHINNPHHDVAAAHYMGWPNGVEKMPASSQEGGNHMQKGLDDGRLDSHQMTGLYAVHRSNSSTSDTSSPPAGGGAGHGGGANMLVVPQPIKGGPHQTNGATGRKYQCKMCPQIFGSKADLQLHTQIHMREAKPYKCSQCNKSFANSSYLSQHTRIHLGIKPYRCEICQRKFTQLSHLQQHIRTHTGDKPYKCRHPGCTKAFSQLSNLQSHSRCHQTDKPYKCNSCYKCFTDETALLEHIPKHKESKHLKTHICQYCGKSYTQETYLAKHMQKHADRADKRPPILTGPGGQPISGGLGGGLTSDAYWPTKVDPGAYAHDRAAPDYGQGLMHPHHRDMVDPRHHMEDLQRQQMSHGLGGYGAESAVKTSSAFSPINSGMLNSSGGFSSAGSRYSFYDPIAFPKHHTQVGFESKPASTNCFPNQLISLSQIRNYQPPSDHLLQSLKEKAGQVSQ